MNILILENEKEYHKLPMMKVQTQHFIAYGISRGNFVVMKNRFDGLHGIVSQEKVSEYVQKLSELY